MSKNTELLESLIASLARAKPSRAQRLQHLEREVWHVIAQRRALPHGPLEAVAARMLRAEHRTARLSMAVMTGVLAAFIAHGAPVPAAKVFDLDVFSSFSSPLHAVLVTNNGGGI